MIRRDHEEDSKIERLISRLSSPDIDTRRSAALALDHESDPNAMIHLKRLADDKSSSVRRVALHSISCAACKEEPIPYDVIPVLIKSAESDTSIRVRRVATHLLGNQQTDLRAREVLRKILQTASDEKLLRIAKWSLAQHGEELQTRCDP